MTVDELIAMLQRFDGSLQVRFECEECDEYMGAVFANVISRESVDIVEIALEPEW